MMNPAVARNDIANFRDLKYVFTHSHPIIATLDITKCSLNDDSKPMPDFFPMHGLKRFNSNGGFADKDDTGIHEIRFCEQEKLVIDRHLESFPIPNYKDYSLISELSFKRNRQILYRAELRSAEFNSAPNDKTVSNYTCPWQAVVFN